MKRMNATQAAQLLTTLDALRDEFEGRVATHVRADQSGPLMHASNVVVSINQLMENLAAYRAECGSERREQVCTQCGNSTPVVYTLDSICGDCNKNNEQKAACYEEQA